MLELKEKIIKNTIIHELIHCLPYCNNHGAEFKRYSKLIEETLGYQITRTGNKKEDYQKSNLDYQEETEYHYKIQCQECGIIFYRKRLKKGFTRKYRCGKCKGRLTIMEEVK